MPSFLLLFLLSLTVASTTPHPSKIAKVVPAPAKEAPAPVAPTKVSLPVPPAAITPEMAAFAVKAKAQIFGLNMQSETDAPFRVAVWVSDKPALTPADIALLAGQKADAKVEIQTPKKFLANAILVEDWMNDDEKANAARFQKLLEMLQTELDNPQVYLFGERERTVVIVGKIKGGFGGLVTLVVET